MKNENANEVKKPTMADIDQANLDLGFVEGFLKMLFELAGKTGSEISGDMICPLVSETLAKVRSINGFINPEHTVKKAA